MRVVTFRGDDFRDLVVEEQFRQVTCFPQETLPDNNPSDVTAASRTRHLQRSNRRQGTGETSLNDFRADNTGPVMVTDLTVSFDSIFIFLTDQQG